MKLKIKEFEALARQNGYRNGKALMKKLGAGKCAYGCRETLQSFKSKYISVGGTLY